MLDLAGPTAQGKLDPLRAFWPGHVRSSETAKGDKKNPKTAESYEIAKGDKQGSKQKTTKKSTALP